MGTIETRHTEKVILFALRCAKTIEDFQKATNQLEAMMEPEDVELVQKKVLQQKKEEEQANA